ncbi:MAG: carboxypeptidase regulatory-like domain-containing protein [Planctomycetaceae bacterium]|nr:carboxypeptidase regulatory-like domain-containing protein [Planctomycetaceae bacterium]
MRAGLILLGVMLVAGCGGQGGRNVEGTVVFSDGSPLVRGNVILTNEKNTYQGALNDQGVFKMEGVLDGTYNVAIAGAVMAEAGNGEMQYDADGNYIEPKPVEPAPLINAKFQKPDTSGLSITVPGDYKLTVDRP